MQRQHYTTEEKNAVLSRYAVGDIEVKQLLAEHGIPKSTFNQWLREYDRRLDCNGKYDFSPRNFRHLIKRNDHLEDLLSVLNASYCSPNASHTERLLEAERLYRNYNVHLVCEALNISRSSFYNHIKRNKREQAWYFLRREELKREIRDSSFRFPSLRLSGESHGAFHRVLPGSCYSYLLYPESLFPDS